MEHHSCFSKKFVFFSIDKIHSAQIAYLFKCNKFFLKVIKLINIQIAISTRRINRSSPSQVFFQKSALKIYSEFTREHPCQSVISIKLQSNFIEITLRHGCSPVNLLHILRTSFLRIPLRFASVLRLEIYQQWKVAFSTM